MLGEGFQNQPASLKQGCVQGFRDALGVNNIAKVASSESTMHLLDRPWMCQIDATVILNNSRSCVCNINYYVPAAFMHQTDNSTCYLQCMQQSCN